MVDHPNARNVRTRVEITNGAYLNVVEVETDLAINFGHPNFDRAAFDALSAACGSYFNENKMKVDRLDIVEVK